MPPTPLPPPCKSGCLKAADSGKNQSATKRICSSLAGILTGEIGKTKNKTKLGILQGGLEYVNKICDSGGSPDLAKITKGLPEEDKARISQKTNAALFDGVADRPDKDFGPASSNPPALTGRGGQVADLKTSEPDINKTSPVTEFGLQNKPAILLASASPAQSPADTGATALAAGSTQKAEAASSPACPEADRMDDLIREYQLTLDYYQKELGVLNSGGGVCKPGSPGYTKI
ncbi:MAG: hypothetical protein HY796_06350, partial [Elusimicrobia bacterium]|nr:hypothetical protein [Elusimicrobiota bacterium]